MWVINIYVYIFRNNVPNSSVVEEPAFFPFITKGNITSRLCHALLSWFTYFQNLCHLIIYCVLSMPLRFNFTVL